METKQKSKSKVPEWKKKAVIEIRKLAEEYPTVAIVNLDNLPTKQLQLIKKKLKDKILIKVTKKILIKQAFEGSDQDRIKTFVEYVKGMPGLVFTKLGAFELFKILKENRRNAPLKPGQITPEEIWVKEGPTPFAPGPVISDFGALGIKTGVEGGKIAVKRDTLVLKKGDKASFAAASILSRLGIEPVKIGINLDYVLEGKEVYPAEALDIDMDAYIANVQKAYLDSFTLAVELGIINSETVTHLIKKAYNNAKAVAVSTNLITPETAKDIISKVESQAKALGKIVSK